jgi:hypothetical protein
MKWTAANIATAKRMIAISASLAQGYKAVAEKLGTSTTAVRLKYERGAFGDVKPASAPKDNDSTLQASLKAYDQALNARAESSHVKTLERDRDALRKALDTMAALTKAPLVPVKRLELGSGLREATAVAALSDAHVEEIVRPGETPYPNEYNPTIADRRLARFFAGFEWLIGFHRTAFKIRTALLWLGGDLMTGHIHPENIENTATPPIKTLLWLRPRITAGIDRLLADPKLERLLLPCSYGNHGRNTPKPYRALGAVHSYEWLLYQWLADTYRNEPRVQFLADETAHQYAKVYDFNMHFHHGDETNYGGGVGGITIPLNKAVAQWDIARKCDYHQFGHWHQYLDNGRLAVNGSVIGYNGYAMSIKATPEPPQQSFYLIDSKRGKTCKSPIWVSDSTPMKRVA